jgi:hypothetical protein
LNEATESELEGIMSTAERVFRRKRSFEEFSVTVVFPFCCEPWLEFHTFLLLCLLSCLACRCLVYSPGVIVCFETHSCLVASHAFQQCVCLLRLFKEVTHEADDCLLTEIPHAWSPPSPSSSLSCCCLLALLMVLVFIIRAVDWLQLNHGDVFIGERGGCRFFHPQRSQDFPDS